VNHQNEAESVYESQLYASLGESFDYYYSMGLWDFQQITEFVSLLDSDSSKERPYIIGRIDAVLNYNEYYLSLLRSGQSQLETKILPEDFILKLNTFNVAKRDYLALLSSALLNSTFTLNSEFLSGHALLSDILKELNLKISEFDEEERAQYVQQLDEAIALISELSNALE
jgi:hypothetical protein